MSLEAPTCEDCGDILIILDATRFTCTRCGTMVARPRAAPTSDVLTADEVAELLRVNVKTVYDAAGRGEIPHRRLGRRLLFSRSTVLAWLSCSPSTSEGST